MAESDAIDTDDELDEDYIDLPDLQIPAEMVRALFEPWDALDAALDYLERTTRTNQGAPEPIRAAIAAREALRLRIYPVMREFQAVARAREAERKAANEG